MAARKGKEIGAEMQRKSDCIDALATFDTTLKRRPNRLGATIGRPKRRRGVPRRRRTTVRPLRSPRAPIRCAGHWRGGRSWRSRIDQRSVGRPTAFHAKGPPADFCAICDWSPMNNEGTTHEPADVAVPFLCHENQRISYRRFAVSWMLWADGGAPSLLSGA
jgi:hypothetical protein